MVEARPFQTVHNRTPPVDPREMRSVSRTISASNGVPDNKVSGLQTQTKPWILYLCRAGASAFWFVSRRLLLFVWIEDRFARPLALSSASPPQARRQVAAARRLLPPQLVRQIFCWGRLSISILAKRPVRHFMIPDWTKRDRRGRVRRTTTKREKLRLCPSPCPCLDRHAHASSSASCLASVACLGQSSEPVRTPPDDAGAPHPCCHD